MGKIIRLRICTFDLNVKSAQRGNGIGTVPLVVRILLRGVPTTRTSGLDGAMFIPPYLNVTRPG